MLTTIVNFIWFQIIYRNGNRCEVFHTLILIKIINRCFNKFLDQATILFEFPSIMMQSIFNDLILKFPDSRILSLTFRVISAVQSYRLNVFFHCLITVNLGFRNTTKAIKGLPYLPATIVPNLAFLANSQQIAVAAILTCLWHYKLICLHK